jgi:hypothetical protein
MGIVLSWYYNHNVVVIGDDVNRSELPGSALKKARSLECCLVDQQLSSVGVLGDLFS